jgi:hypothetical protein
MIEAIDMRLKDIAVAMGAPMKPIPRGGGPQTGSAFRSIGVSGHRL